MPATKAASTSAPPAETVIHLGKGKVLRKLHSPTMTNSVDG